ncbi:ectopic P granules protein 5 homolog isoform X1 [Trichogramma pretiosum]|uniref:ectopic P granules protein 5 homolog isoform X1 n=1 Tax=Trichogramma pretiosum TaxID=7493 RepID=UPI0006C9AFDF|nr:ectopic P granules protein 5 homolog isoform X1 [Trichogramma pretiosum]
MEKQRPRQKKKEHSLSLAIDCNIPDAPTLEEFECLLGESPSNYPKGEGIENMESELHSAAIDTSIYEKEDTRILIEDAEEEVNLNTLMDKAEIISVDEVDTVTPIQTTQDVLPVVPSAPEIEDLERSVEETIASVSAMDLESAPTAPIMDNISHNLTVSYLVPQNYQKPVDMSKSDYSPRKTMSTSTIQKTVKPFTEGQLTALYSNQELSVVESFVNEFVEFQLCSHAVRQQHKLHELLMSYLRVRNNLIVNAHEMENLKIACKETQKQLWCLDKATVTESGECQDGNPVSATHEYSVAHFNQQTLVALTRNLSAIKESLHNVQALHGHEAEILRLQIDHYIQRVCISCKEFANLTANAPVCLTDYQHSSHTMPQLVELRMCITILFNFQRKILKDNKFVIDTRDWLSKLIAVLLRVATWQDHLFILSHILRCPGGVASWARSFVQVPVAQRKCSISASPLSDPYLDHIVATLAVILMPVKEREQFLEQVQLSLQDTGTGESDTIWVMLDEEGEEDEDIANTGANLSEMDLISILHQIPLSKLFELALHIDPSASSEQNRNTITEHHMLRLFSFSTVIIRLLKRGLKTYDSPRYRQLAKRLSALIRDVVQYVSDLWESFEKQKVTDPTMLSRLYIEYDCFFLRAVLCIFSSRRLGAWQYLAAIPYRIVSLTTLWQIFYILHTDSVPNDLLDPDAVAGWEMDLNSASTRKIFEEKLSHLPGDESYFLLTTFANMAMARTYQDYEFVRAATIDLFQIGFLSAMTQDSCSKDARSLLSNLTIKYPSLLSDILVKLKDNFESVGKLSLYLFTELSINQWVPKDDDLRILSNWLHHFPLNSTESHLARLIISHLNWGFDAYDNLYLPLEFHRQMALLIVELTIKYVPENTPAQTASILSESVKQVSSMVRPQSNEQAFSHWAWDTLARLRLHQLEQSDSVCQYSISYPSQAFSSVPDLEADAKLEILVNGIRDKQPVACYVAIRMTLMGHSVPLICNKGFELLQTLQTHYKYKQLIITLNSLVPLFLDCPESLIKHEKFISVIVSLIQADKTYMKMAKNFISPDFPGPILKSFASMIEFQLQCHKRFCLSDPDVLVKLWLNTFVLLPDWNRDQGIMYIMDILVRASFFHLGARAATENIFQDLFSLAISGSNENISTTRSGGSGFGSLFSWATGGAQSPSLLSNCSSQSVWLAYQILRIEQFEREIKTGLWRELLRELGLQTKSSLDSVLKKTCAALKIPSFNSNSLAIYRWSQQALDTPMDHPLLPLLWQNLFTLYLARVPSSTGAVDKGGVGNKFFEGMMNVSYMKKIKSRLLETTEYFQAKGESDLDDDKPITDERRIFYLDTAKFYKTLSLWLDEPRLQEAGLYLPALPPQYMSQKLVLILQNNQDQWLEYVDYESVKQSQFQLVQDWCNYSHQTLPNTPNTQQAPSQTPTTPLESADPIERISHRLNNYELPVAAPPLSKSIEVVPHVPRKTIYEPDALVGLVKPHLKLIMEYAQTFNLLISEHTAIDCSFLELVPTLYKDTESQVTLHALCDPAPSGQRRSRSGTPPIVHCAGAAVIRIKVLEARVSDGVDQMISQNRAEYENLLVKASQPPPHKVTQGCVFIDHLIALLEHELQANKTTENTSILRNIQQSGVKLFYHLVQFYTEEASLCPATKQLITTCVEKLGQLFVSGEESQGPRLLLTIIDRPYLGGLLGPHFTPVAGGASTFLQMYQTLVELSSGSNIDLCFVLLTKFDVGSWLNYRRPRLSERSTFIDLIMRALCNAGLNPEDDRLVLHELFRNHLRLVLLHDFPEHYGEVLTTVLRGSESQSLSIDVWRDLLGALSGRAKNSPMPLQGPKVREEIRRYATEQRLLSRQEIHDTAMLLGKHFMTERLQYGLYGLYPKYRIYNEPITTFLGMIGHALVVLTLQSDRGTLADQLCEKIWPVLSDMFAPWITPYWTRNLREPTAAWIQQLTDDRSVLLPWIITDGPFANRTMSMFVECIRFITDTMPASNRVLCYVWQFYVQNYAHPSIKDHILNVVHGNMLSLPWDKFNPTVVDVELMLKVIDQYLPDSHLFLGSIFFGVNWQQWMTELLGSQQSPALLTRVHVCLLNLFVKLSNEPNVRQNDRALKAVQDAERYSWHLVDAAAYDQVINWHVMSCDPRVVLTTANSDVHPIDIAVHNLLKVVAAYDTTVVYFHPTTLKKRQMYVRSSVKLLVNCTTRHKNLVTSNIQAFTLALSRMLDEMEAVVGTVSESQQIAEAGLLVTELLHSVNQSGVLAEQLRSSWAEWLLRRSGSSPVLLGILRVVGLAVAAPATLGEIMEAALEAYFKQNVVEETRPTWAAVLRVLQPIVPRQPPVESVLVSEGRVLALHAIFLKRLPSCTDIKEEGMLLTNLIEWISAIKPTEANEEKMPLLWAKALELIYRQCQYNESTVVAARALRALARTLMAVADDAGQGWNILGAIGLRKGSQLSHKCKFLSRALAVYCLAQLPESKPLTNPTSLDQGQSTSSTQLVRFTPHSPGVAPPRSDIESQASAEVRPSPEAVKAMQSLESLLGSKQYTELKNEIEQAIRIIRDSANSLHNSNEVCGALTAELYSQRYLHPITE